jgi:ubiquinone/menaquinone biosynthesis C-methylase UbiE
VYLFHELPEDVRKKVVAEMARVVRRGGVVILTDSIQLGDRPIVDANLGRFSNMNEPYYDNYIRINFGTRIRLISTFGLHCAIYSFVDSWEA